MEGAAVGGGLGAVPHQAKVLDEFVSEEELLPISQAIGRVFARLGEKRNRARARLKFLIAKIGIDEFKQVQVQFPNGETQWMSVGLAKQLGATYSHSLMRKGV